MGDSDRSLFFSDLWLIQAIGAILVSSSLLCLRETRFRLCVWLKTVSEISSIRLFSKYSSWTTDRAEKETKCLTLSELERKMFWLVETCGQLLEFNVRVKVGSRSVVRFLVFNESNSGGVTSLSLNSYVNRVLLVQRSWQISLWFFGTVSGYKCIIHPKTKFAVC